MNHEERLQRRRELYRQRRDRETNDEIQERLRVLSIQKAKIAYPNLFRLSLMHGFSGSPHDAVCICLVIYNARYTYSYIRTACMGTYIHPHNFYELSIENFLYFCLHTWELPCAEAPRGGGTQPRAPAFRGPHHQKILTTEWLPRSCIYSCYELKEAPLWLL